MINTPKVKSSLLFMHEMRLVRESVKDDLLSCWLDEFGCYTWILYNVLLKLGFH